LATVLLFLTALIAPAHADDQAPSVRIQEEISALPLPIPMFAYLVRPVGDGPFPLVIMNHGVSLNPRDRSFLSSGGIQGRSDMVCASGRSRGGARRIRIWRLSDRHS
jgi:hypothetical protein